MGFWRDIAPKYGKHLIILMLVFLQIMIGIGGGIVATGIYYEKNNIVFPGVEVSGIHLQRLTQAEARDLLSGKLSLPSAITLVWQEEHFEVLLDDTVSHYMLDKLIVKAGDITEFTGDVFSAFNLISWSPQQQCLTPKLTASPAYLWRELINIKSMIDREPQNACIILDDGVPLLQLEEWGVSLDVESSRNIILEFLANGETEKIPLQVNDVKPDITAAQLPDFNQLLGTGMTSLDNNEADRIYNIQLATEMLSELSIEPGEVFSFNETLGEATAEKGFRKVLIVLNRDFVPGVGGGICQLASTIYQAALKAELEIVQRSPHSRPVSYIPLGQDAAVSYNLLDLKIRNNRNFPILMVGKANDFLQFAFYGAEWDETKKIEIISEDIEVMHPQTLEQPDPNLPRDARQIVREGQDGYKVYVHRVTYKNDRKVSLELISTDFYMPVHEVVRVGSKQVPLESK